MRAGLLREPILFQKRERIQSPSGAYTFKMVILLRTKCHKLRERPIGIEINAKEEFYEQDLRVQCRDNPLIDASTDVMFQNKSYRILLIDKQIKDKSVIIHLKLNNE